MRRGDETGGHIVWGGAPAKMTLILTLGLDLAMARTLEWLGFHGHRPAPSMKASCKTSQQSLWDRTQVWTTSLQKSFLFLLSKKLGLSDRWPPPHDTIDFKLMLPTTPEENKIMMQSLFRTLHICIGGPVKS